jgi:3-hydroxybutyryl-CoA dehydrogenase
MDVAVLGAGGTGRGIAQLAAVSGHAVRLHDRDVDAVMDGIDAIEAALDDAVAAGEIADATRVGAVERIDGTTGLEAAVSGADIVIEATGRDQTARRELLADVEEFVDGEAPIATSCPTGSVTAVAVGLRNPGRTIGLHFIDPPSGPLVEVVVAEGTTEPTRDAAVDFVRGLDRESIVVGDAPGFATTRLGLALAVEAMRMLERGVAGVEAVDRAMELGHDHPIGPLAASDAAGLDARLSALESLADTLGERYEPPQVLREKVAAGDLGRKTGEGFYVWEGDEPIEPADPDPTPDLPGETPADPADR